MGNKIDMNNSNDSSINGFIFYSLFFICIQVVAAQNSWDCFVLPSESKTIIDRISKAKIVYTTTSPANDRNLYFHDRCWTSDGQLMLFYSDRFNRQEIMGYLKNSGELVRLNQSEDNPAVSAVASFKNNIIYVVRNNQILQWKININSDIKTSVNIDEEKICELPQEINLISGLNENSNGTLLSYGYQVGDGGSYRICVVSLITKKSEIISEVGFPIQNIQFSKHNPNLISFARSYGNDTAPLKSTEPPHARIWLLNTQDKKPRPAFYQQPGELVTHECWWLNNLITFCGGFRPEESHVKIFDKTTGTIRIAGAGAWWKQGTPYELSKLNWWHAAGSPDGRWIAADNWHGDIVLFDAKTTQRKVLTEGHRTYGSGAHPHVGWDNEGKSVEFTSNINGNPDVCIGVIPQNWFRE
jgi:hypothetical protein